MNFDPLGDTPAARTASWRSAEALEDFGGGLDITPGCPRSAGERAVAVKTLAFGCRCKPGLMNFVALGDTPAARTAS